MLTFHRQLHEELLGIVWRQPEANFSFSATFEVLSVLHLRYLTGVQYEPCYTHARTISNAHLFARRCARGLCGRVIFVGARFSCRERSLFPLHRSDGKLWRRDGRA